MAIVKLTEKDWLELMPSVAVALGKTIIEIKPLGVDKLKSVVLKATAAYQELVGREITLESLDTPEGIAKVFAEVIDCAPALLEELIGLDKEDIVRLPIAKGVELFRAAIEVNLSSYEDLLKNFKALGAMMEKAEGAVKVGDLPK